MSNNTINIEDARCKPVDLAKEFDFDDCEESELEVYDWLAIRYLSLPENALRLARAVQPTARDAKALPLTIVGNDAQGAFAVDLLVSFGYDGRQLDPTVDPGLRASGAGELRATMMLDNGTGLDIVRSVADAANAAGGRDAWHVAVLGRGVREWDLVVLAREGITPVQLGRGFVEFARTEFDRMTKEKAAAVAVL